MALPALSAADVGAHGPFCSIQKRALGLASEDKKVFILHDEGQNSTIARNQTTGLAAKLDEMGVTTYYRCDLCRSAILDGQLSDLLTPQAMVHLPALPPIRAPTLWTSTTTSVHGSVGTKATLTYVNIIRS